MTFRGQNVKSMKASHGIKSQSFGVITGYW